VRETSWYLPDRDRNPHFIGRQTEIETIRRQLQSGQIVAVTEIADLRSTGRIAALIGLGGIGKTQTAIEYAFQYADDYDYIFFLHADDPGKIKRDYARIAKLLKLRPWERGLDGLVQVVLEWMTKTAGWLLIVDNVDRPEQVAPFLPRNGKGHVLVTSRLQALDAMAKAVQRIPIGLFTPDESRKLLLLLTQRNTQDDPSEETALLEIVRGMGGLPVALEQAATYIRLLPCTFADYWREFSLRRTELFANPLAHPYKHDGIVFSPRVKGRTAVDRDDETTIADRDKAIATTWDINFRRIEFEASKRKGTPQSAAPDLLLVSAFLSPDDIPMDLLAAGAGELGPRVADALQRDGKLGVNEALHLVHKFSLIEIKLETRAYNMHRLVQEVVRKWWMTPEQRLLWAKRVIEVLRRGTRILQASEGDWPDSLKDQHFASSVATILMDEWKKEDFEFEEAAELLSQAGYLLTKTDRHQDANKFLERAVAIREKLLGPDHLDVAETLNHFANNLAEWGHNREALPYYVRSLQIRTQKQGKDHQDIAQVQNDFGIACFNLYDYDEAKKHYLEALRIWEKGGDQNLIGTAMFNLAMIYQNQGKEEKKAEEHFRAAHTKITNPHMRAHVCRCFGDFLAKRGRDTEALPLLREGRNIAKKRFGEESESILDHNDSLRGPLDRLGLKKELKEIDRESKMIRERSQRTRNDSAY
jgi:tetratricopeptide (TPR) repeat protein